MKQNKLFRHLANIGCLVLAFIICFSLFFGGVPKVKAASPEEMLTNPAFDATQIDEKVMNEWLKQNVEIPDNNFYNALKNAAGVEEVDGLTRQDLVNLSGTLDLTKSGITNLSGAEYLINVDTLILTNNKISSLEPIKNLYRLGMLDVSYNSLTSLNGYIFELESLTEFSAEDNKIATITAPGTISNIVTLSLRNNELKELPSLSKFSKLENLDISGNKITALKLDDNLASTLVSLTATNNQIASTISFAAYTKLTTLNISLNSLTAFPKGITSATGLKNLYLNSNDIEKIPSTISTLTNLEILQLEDNAISSLPESLTDLPNLTSLLLSLNFLDTKAALDIKNSMPSVKNFTYQLQKPTSLSPTLSKIAEPLSYTMSWDAIAVINSTTEGSLTLKNVVIERREYTKGASDEVVKQSQYAPLTTLLPTVTTYTDATATADKDYEYKITYVFTHTYNKLSKEVTTKGFILYTDESKQKADVGSGSNKLLRRIILLSVVLFLMLCVLAISYLGFKFSRKSRWHKDN